MTAAPAISAPIAALEAEREVLGSLIVMGAEDRVPALIRVREALPARQAWALEAHGELFAALCRLVDRGAVVDPVSLGEELRGARALEALGGTLYLAEILDGFPLGQVLDHHLELIRDRWLRREVSAHARAAIEAAKDLTIEVGTAIAETVQALSTTAAPILHRRTAVVRDILWPAMSRIEERAKSPGKQEGVPTGLVALDALVHGWKPGQLVLVAARPSVGKTGLAVQLALAAGAVGTSVYFASYEMTKEELVERMLGAEGGVNLHHRQLADHDYTRLARASGVIQGMPIVIDDSSQSTPAALRLNVQHQGALDGKPVGLVIVDYLQLMCSGQRTQNRNEEVGAISRALKIEVARGLNVPVIALSQLSRASEQRGGDRRPILSDLRDSGSLEQDADVVLMLHQPAGPDWPKSCTEVLLRKQRNGPTGEFKAYFNRATGRWDDWSDREEGAAA